MPERKKSLNELKIAGTVRKDRHANRGNVPTYDGEPVMPKHLKGEAKRLWQRIVPRLVTAGVVSDIDTEFIVMTCEVWSLYRRSVESANRLPPSESIKTITLGYARQVAECFKRLGMSPQDRQRLVIVPAPEPDATQSLTSFARIRG